MSEANAAAEFAPVLWALKQEAGTEVRRLRHELSRLREQLLSYDLIEERAKQAEGWFGGSAEAAGLRGQLPHALEREALRAKLPQLELDLRRAEERLETELAAIRQSEIAAGSAERRVPRAKRELAELLEAGARVLNDYSEKLDRLVNLALVVLAEQDADQELRALFLDRLGSRLTAVSEPLTEWVRKLSAAHEEGRLTETQRLELRLRLTEFEVNFHTAQGLFRKIGALQAD